jgi:hypothetical protein
MHSIKLMLFYYNFIWQHGTHGQTPAMAAGLSDHHMTFLEMLLHQTNVAPPEAGGNSRIPS